MAINGVNSYINNYTEYSNQTNQAKNSSKAENTNAAEKDVEKDIKNQDVSDYYNYLKKNYSAMQQGNVSISGEYLKNCASNKQKAKELEDFIKKIPELEEQGYKELSARNKALGGTVTYYQQSWVINKDGSVQSTVYSVTETGMTNAERMKKNMDERLEKQKEKKAEEKKAEEKREEEKKAEDQKAGLKEDGEIIVKDTSGTIDGLGENKLYQSMKVDYVDAESMEELEKKMQDGHSDSRTSVDVLA
ncbi:MAG: hypothetical protein HFH74_06875 [Lachnospiraceae bacterium]|jgi:hypothetical protein|nr:hypothetical protein [Lachnospiraceae bacterium]